MLCFVCFVLSLVFPKLGITIHFFKTKCYRRFISQSFFQDESSFSLTYIDPVTVIQEQVEYILYMILRETRSSFLVMN